MPGLPLIAIILFCGSAAEAGDAAPTAPPMTAETRQAVLRQALVDFDAAVAAKDRGGAEAQRRYRQALAGFQSLADSGVRSGGLYYNLGNTQLRLGDVGKAVVYYRRALRLAPADERIAQNLDAARKLCRVQIRTPAASEFMQTLLFWHFGTSLAGRVKVALIAYVLFWALLLVRLFAFRGSPGLTWTIRTVAVVVLVVGASVAWDIAVEQHRLEGVIVADDVVLRKGNGEYYEPMLEQNLSGGVEFRLLETRQDVQGASWYQVELLDGKKGWLRADQAEVI